MVIRALSILLLLAAPVLAQDSVFSHTSNVSDLNPERDAFTAVPGSFRITHYANNGGVPVDLGTASFPVPLTITHMTDGYVIRTVGSFDRDIANNFLRWQFSINNPGTYELKASVTYPDDTYPIYWRYLTVAEPPPAETSITVSGIVVEANTIITNVVSSTLIINLEGNTVAEIVQP